MVCDLYDLCVKWISTFIADMADNARIIVQYCVGHVHPGRKCPSPSVDMPLGGAYPTCVDMPHDINTMQWLISIYYIIMQLLI